MRVRFLFLLVVLAAACGGDDGVKPPGPSGVTIDYSPDPGEVVLVIPDSVVLSVGVTPAQPFTVQFLLGDSLVHTGTEWKVMGDRVREERYRAIVHVNDEWYDDDWVVRVVSQIDRPTPPPTAPVASLGSLPGVIAMRWDRPSIDLIDEDAPLEGFEIAASPAPFTAEQFDDQDISFVADRPGIIRQSADITGLVERQTYYLRVRTVDVLGRSSWPTAQVSSPSTGSFQLSGTVWQIGASGWREPVGSVLLEAGPSRVTTVEDGLFVLGGLPDSEPLVLSAQEGSGLYTLPILTTPLETLDRELDLVLVPRLVIDVIEGGVVTESTLHELLLEATRSHPTIPPFDFHAWPAYPVKVWVWEYSVPGEDVQYHEAFATAIDRWNDGAVGEQRLLEYVPVSPDFDPTTDPDAVGVMVRHYEPAPTWPNLGEVNFIRPAGGSVAVSDPLLLELSLRPNFFEQSLAERVIAHELGHVLGLVHVRSEANLMHATSDQSQGFPTEGELFVARYIRHGAEDMQSNWIVEQ